MTADAAGEIHVHSDPEQSAAYGVGTTRISLGAFEIPGQYEVESHTLGGPSSPSRSRSDPHPRRGWSPGPPTAARVRHRGRSPRPPRLLRAAGADHQRVAERPSGRRPHRRGWPVSGVSSTPPPGRCGASSDADLRLLRAGRLRRLDNANNPIFGMTYVWLWVGLVPFSLLFGPVFQAISPARTIVAGLRGCAATGDPPFACPSASATGRRRSRCSPSPGSSWSTRRTTTSAPYASGWPSTWP